MEEEIMDEYKRLSDDQLAQEFAKQWGLYVDAEANGDYNIIDICEVLADLRAEIVKRWLYEQGVHYE
jgi:hypothetical protein